MLSEKEELRMTQVFGLNQKEGTALKVFPVLTHLISATS